MKKLFIFFIPITLFIMQVGFSVPEVSSAVPTWLKLTVATLIIFLFIINQTYSVFIPFKKFKRFEKTKLRFLDRESDELIKGYKKHGFDLRINVMLPKRKLLSWKEPKANNPNKTKLVLFRKQFETIWVSHTMYYEEDRNLNLTINQGVCGEAYRSGSIKIADLTISDPATYNLCSEQLQRTRDLKFILSCPIYELDHENFRLTDRIIGVVNFDSKSEGSEVLIKDDEYLNDLIDKIRAFSVLCSHIF